MIYGYDEVSMTKLRLQFNIRPSYKMIDTCASEFSAYVPYFYSTYEPYNESIKSDRKRLS